MGEKAKGYFGKVKDFFKKLPKKIIAIVIAMIVLIIAAVLVFNMTRPYSVLFADLSSDEAYSIMTYLEDNGVTDYRLENNDTILVRTAQEPILKARLLMEGYPQTGFSYSEYYDNIGALSTEAERNTALLLALQERMGATIKCFDGVKDATVGITQGEDNTYVLDSGNKIEASAYVLVTMQDGKMLTDDQAIAIRNLVANGVQGLQIDSVSISDTMGNNYTVGSDDYNARDASELKLYLEQKYNNLIRTNIMQVLIPVFGDDNVRVSVNTVVDVNLTIQDSTDVYLPEWAADGSTDGEGIIGSKVYDNYIVREEDETVGGTVGTTTNADLPTYVEEEIEPDGDEAEISTSGQIDYDNSRDQTHMERTAGYITDCMVSVSINSTEAGMVDTDAWQLHVARAAGIGNDLAAEKISIITSPFFVPEEPGPIIIDSELPVDMWVIYAAAGGLLLFIILLIIILVIRGKRKKKKRLEEERRQQMLMREMAAAAMAVPDTGADVMSMNSEKTMELRRDIRKFADDNPEIAAKIVRSMMRGGEENG